MKRVFVLFGSTGDLAKRKIYPALKEINKDYNFELIAVGRQDLTKEKFLETCVGENNFGKISYRKIINSNKELPDFLREIEKNDEIIFYLSTPPKAFYEIVEGFSKLDLKNKKYKIVFEKPFGKDYASFRELNDFVSKVFDESQIYRVDHYICKEGVLNILNFRKSNEYEKYWNSKYIKKIEIIAKESIGIEKRAGYYEEMGAVKDMVQSHLLQMLAFTTMDITKNEKEEKIRILENTQLDRGEILGQYESYKREENVNPESNTETFARLKMSINLPKWKNTEVIILTGKKLDKKETKVVVNFFEKENLPRSITFEIYPKERICFENESCKYEKTETKESYINVIEGIFEGKKEIFLSERGLDASWKIVDKVNKENILIYPDGSNENAFEKN